MVARRTGQGAPLRLVVYPGFQLPTFSAPTIAPSAMSVPLVDGRLQLTPAQLALLIEGIDWRRTIAPDPARRPARV
jgi:transposase